MVFILKSDTDGSSESVWTGDELLTIHSGDIDCDSDETSVKKSKKRKRVNLIEVYLFQLCFVVKNTNYNLVASIFVVFFCFLE
jgi:hypothetical protein